MPPTSNILSKEITIKLPEFEDIKSFFLVAYGKGMRENSLLCESNAPSYISLNEMTPSSLRP